MSAAVNIERVKQEPRILVEVGILLGIPAGLLLLHATVRPGWAVEHYFYPANPSLIDAWTAAVLHASWNHVVSNALAYTITILTTYLLFYQWGRRRVFWLLVGGILLSTPPVVNYINVIVFSDHLGIVTPEMNMKGFSGVASAFLGMFWVTIACYANHRSGTRIGYWLVFLAYLLVGMGVFLTYGAATSTILLVCAAIGLGVLLAGYQIRSSFDNLSRRRIREWMRSDWDAVLMVWCMPMGLVLVMALFPATPGSGETMTNIVGHMSGLAFGFLSSLILLTGHSWWHSTPNEFPHSSGAND